MPLLVCPNCNVGMTPVQRNGVEIDVCPQCRGVWLDRGELEKLLQPLREAACAPTFLPAGTSMGESHHGEHHGDGHHGSGHHGPWGKPHKTGWRGLLEAFD